MSYIAPLMNKLSLLQEDYKNGGELADIINNNQTLKEAITFKTVIDNQEVGRDDVGIYYLRGFTGGEVLKGYAGTLSKQGLYNKAESIDKEYQKTHRSVRDKIEEEVNEYYFFERPNVTGTLENVRKDYTGRGYTQLYKKYLHAGGTAPMYDEQLESTSKYIEYYPSIAKGDKIEGFDDKQYKSMLAGFYRFRKTEVDKAIILGDMERIAWLHPSPEYVQKRTQAVLKRIRGIAYKFSREQSENPTQAILSVFIEHELEVFGEQARFFYIQAINDVKEAIL